MEFHFFLDAIDDERQQRVRIQKELENRISIQKQHILKLRDELCNERMVGTN